MAWPKGKPRTPRVIEAPKTEQAVAVEEDPTPAPYIPKIPLDWRVGMLLNVRNTGADYTITLFPEEFDPRKPDRALHFTNPGHAQDFVSRWYSRESHDPRAR